MGGATILLSVVASCLLVSAIEAAGGDSCPLPSKVYGCSPKCTQTYECTHGKVCCPNACNAKSCTEAARNGAGGGGDKYSQSNGGTGIYCGNKKCSPHEVCKTDPTTKRQICGRA